MPLNKGFLTRPLLITKRQIVFGTIWWIVMSFLLYLAFSLTREILRGMTGFLLYSKQMPLILSGEETQLYNLFYAAVASALGFLWSSNYILKEIYCSQNPKERMVIRRVINETGLISWSFLFWFAKIAFTYGIFYLQFPFQLDIDILRDLPYFLILFPIVMLMNVWPQLQFVFGKNKWRYLIGILSIFAVMSLTFSFKNVVDPLLINEIKKNQSFVYKYSLTLPKSLTQFSQEVYSTSDIFLVKDSLNGGRPLLFFNDIKNQITIDKLAENIYADRMKLDELERTGINLFIDKDISMNEVDELRNYLRKINEQNIQLPTIRKFAKFSSNNPYDKNAGLYSLYQLPYYPELETFLDSAEKLDFTKYAIKLSNSLMYRSFNRTNKKYVVEFFVDETHITLNGRKFSEEKASEIIYKLIKKYPERAVIIFERKNTITYDRHIEMLDLVFTQYMRIRQEYALKCFNKPYNEIYDYDDFNEIRYKFPMQILEWSPEEKRLIKLIRKQKMIQKKKVNSF